MAATPTFPSGIGVIAATLVNASSTNWVDVYDNSASSANARVESLSITSDDTATMNVQFSFSVSSTNYLLGTVRVATLSGTDGAAARINALATVGSISPEGIAVIDIPPGAKLQAKVLVAVTAAKTVTISGWVRKYA